MWLDFVTRMTSSLAWPVIALVLVFVLRQPLTQLLMQRPPRRVKAGPFEMEWERITAETDNEVQAVTGGPPASRESPGVIAIELAMDASVSPAVAVLEAHASIERELRSILQSTPSDTSKMGAVGLARAAGKQGLISTASVNAVEGISVLRNLAAHGSAREITPEQAADYLTLADSVLYALREDVRRSKRNA